MGFGQGLGDVMTLATLAVQVIPLLASVFYKIRLLICTQVYQRLENAPDD